MSCRLIPTENASEFGQPLKPAGGSSWRITNRFGNIVTSKTVPGLPAGSWQHTGIDYLLGGSSSKSQRQTVFAAGSGVVVFSTESNRNPVPSRGGLVIIKHVAPPDRFYRVHSLQRDDVVYLGFQTREVFTYYLHLDPNQIRVSQGDQVRRGQPIAKLYGLVDGFTYRPHLHFEVWRACSSTDPDEYDRPRAEFQRRLRQLLIDPESFLASVSLTKPPPPSPPTDLVKLPVVEGSLGDPYGEIPTVQGQVFPKAAVLTFNPGWDVGTQQRVSFKLTGRFTRLTAHIGYHDNVEEGGICRPPRFEFRVLGDGRELYRAGTPIGPSDPPGAIEVDIRGAKTLTLLNILAPPRGAYGCELVFAVWGDPVVSG